ncbi:toll-like receptor 7 isoform X2 [Ascaphus truei]
MCHGRHLTYVPGIQSPNVKKIDLSKNELTLLAKGSFAGVPNLKILNVSNNCLPSNLRPDKDPCMLTIEKDALVNLRFLHDLDLSGNSLTKVPRLPQNIRILNLNLNRIVVLSERELSGLAELSALKIGFNCYYLNPCESQFTFSGDVFRDIESLQILVLSFNNISSVPRGLPSSLVDLDLSENKIWKIDNDDLSNLTSLQSLNLEWNCQRCDHAAQPCFPCQNASALQLSTEAFHYLRNLSYLNLRGNSLHTLNNSLFDRLSNLKSLVLSDNFLNLEKETFFSKLHNLHSLKIDFNYKLFTMFDKLVLNPTFATMKSLRKISIVGYFFNVLEEKGIEPLLSLPNLSQISLRTNFIIKANLSIFSQHKHLQHVSLAENLISLQDCCRTPGNRTGISPPILSREEKVVPDWVKSVGSSDDKQMGEADVEYPYCWQYQKSVDVSFNNIGSLQPGDFVGMDDVECLNMSYNYINQRLDGRQFGHLQSLRHLDLSHNRFDLYYIKALSELTTLKVLNLAHNEYQFMMKGVNHRLEFLENLTSLTELNLNNNLIGLRITTEFKNPSLEKLLFTNNELGKSWQYGKDTYLNIFTNLKCLKLLDISYNQLQAIPSGVFENMPESIQNLSISNNILHSFHWDKIGHLGNLTHLDLSFNFLSRLYTTTTSISSEIVFLNLKSNQISELNKDFFKSYTKLRQLILSKNCIKMIDEESLPMSILHNLEILDVSANPLNCTCRAHWFINFLMDTQVSVEKLSTGMICHSPEGLRGQSLLSMDPQSCQDLYGHQCFICSSILVSVWMVITIVWKLFSWDLWYTSKVIIAAIRRGYSKLPVNCNSEFDAFIAFNTKDSAVADWVYHELLVHLEGAERGTFNLCLEERDWTAGKSSIENLCEAIYRSKKTVFILSRDGFSCGLLRHAFFMSHQRLLDEKQDVVVLVLLDHKMKMSRYLLTRKRLCPKSYLNWPPNPKAHAHFWQSLRMLLRQDSRRCYNAPLRKRVDG